MIRTSLIAFGLLSSLALGAHAIADEKPPAGEPQTQNATPQPTPSGGESPVAAALSQKIAQLPTEGSDEEKNERAAIAAFYEARKYEPLWVAPKGLTPRGASLVAEIGRAAEWGLSPADFSLPSLSPSQEGAPEL